MTFRRWFGLGALGVLALVAGIGACSERGEQSELPSVGGSGVGGATGGSATGGTIFTGGSGGGCVDDSDCNGGVCNDGVCCASQEAVCGAGCCTTSEVCLFDQCVTPGDDCVTAEDCPPGHFCEPALGDPGSGGTGGQAGNCTQPLEHGKCLPLPPVCTGMNDPPNCIPPCEYFPPTGALNAVVEWHWGYDPAPTQFPTKADVWASPIVARVHDANCDGNINLADPQNIIFVSGNAQNTCCQCTGNAVSACRTGVLRVLDGTSGQEVWSLDVAESGSVGFAGLSPAAGDVDQDQVIDIVAVTGEGKIAVISNTGVVKQLSTTLVNGAANANFGWGGGTALGDMNFDGWPEIAYGRSVLTMQGGTLAPLFTGTAGIGGPSGYEALSHYVDLDANGDLELLAGRSAYHHDGTLLWNQTTYTDGFTAVANFDTDNLPEVVLVAAGQIRILDGLTGNTELGPVAIPGTGTGGPPTVADFDGDGSPEIGVAKANFYSVMEPDYANSTINVLWQQANHDNSSSVTGSSVFDFEGDGRAEVIYNDECYLWVYDGLNGNVLFTANTQSFTATESSIVADVDGDGHAEMVMIANGANPNTWTCAHHTGAPPYPAWSPPANAPNWRGITVFGDSASSWVGTRMLWNQHAYNVTNVCDPRDSACMMGSYYGQIPQNELKNWQLPWLNNFRQNVQDAGIFDAPDATVNLEVECVTPVAMEIQLRNAGLSGLPAGVQVDIYRLPTTLLGSVFSTKALFPGQTELIPFTAPQGMASTTDTFQARIYVDPMNPTFHECRDTNNESPAVKPECVQ